MQSEPRRNQQTALFDAHRPRLLGLAYRILGSLADAEDAVQDTFVKWLRQDPAEIENPAGWLTTACTRRSVDLLRAAHRSRVDYVGAWLPEPVQGVAQPEAEAALELDASLATAFLLLLERLTPKERAAYLLREIFDQPYAEIAETLGLEEAACRKLVSRAKGNVDQANVRHTTSTELQERLLSAFRTAIEEQSPARLAPLLSEDVRLTADGGGKAPALRRVLNGKAEVLDFLTERVSRFWAGQAWSAAQLNGGLGWRIAKDGATATAITFAFDASGCVTEIFLVRNPDKLARLDRAAVLR